MSWSGPGFVIALIAISTVGVVFNNWIRAKHGYPVESDWGSSERSDLTAERKARLMADENERLQGKVTHLEERIAVLERIATDPATRTAREIDALR